jgi:hypothetical protein
MRPKRAQAKRSTTSEATPTSHSRARDWDTLRQEFIKKAPFVAEREDRDIETAFAQTRD